MGQQGITQFIFDFSFISTGLSCESESLSMRDQISNEALATFLIYLV